MMEHSTDRVAIITGASRGIGAGLVEAYCKIGYQVIANSRTIGDSSRPEIVTVAGDIADPATAERLVDVAIGVRAAAPLRARAGHPVVFPGPGASGDSSAQRAASAAALRA